MIRKLLVGVLAGILGVGLFAPPAFAAYEPQGGAHFNVPAPWGTYAQRWALMHQMDLAIDHTPAGAKILVSAFLFDRKITTDKLIAAKRRGVNVRVVIDRDIATGAAARLEKVLNADNLDVGDMETRWGPDGSYLTRCRGACRGGARGGNVHTKFYAFSKVCAKVQKRRLDACAVPSARNVVMVSSANPNAGGAVRGWNDLYTIRGRAKTFRGYEQVHREMTEDSARDGDKLITFRDGPFLHRFYPSDTGAQTADPVMRDLRRVRCRGATGGAGVNGRTVIHISMFWWAGNRGEYIARRILDLARNGCKVNIVYGAPSKVVAAMLRKAARSGLINLYDSRWWLDEDPEVDVRTHQKYVLVSGRLGADTSAWEVWTGSLNWAGNVTANDDSTLNIALRSAYRSYRRNWDNVRYHSTRIPRP